MRLKHNLFYGLTLMALMALAPFSAQAAAALTSTFSTSASGVDVTIINNGSDALYNVSLQPMGTGVDAQAPVSIGDIAAGAKVFIKIDGVSPAGYIFLNGNGSDATGQSVSISIVSKGN